LERSWLLMGRERLRWVMRGFCRNDVMGMVWM
jgi:hypothetical protein